MGTTVEKGKKGGETNYSVLYFLDTPPRVAVENLGERRKLKRCHDTSF